MTNAEEIWKDIPGYEGLYQASNMGRVKSLSKLLRGRFGLTRNIPEKILKQKIHKQNYREVALRKNNSAKCFLVHRLVLFTFCGKSNLKADHKNEIKSDNRLSNLEYVTQRENVTRYISKRKELPTGVQFNRLKKRFKATIHLEGTTKHLGTYDTAEQASEVYQNKIKEVQLESR